MKKVSLFSFSLVVVLALLFIAVNPVAAAGFVVSAVDLTRNGTVMVYLEGQSGPVGTITVAGFDVYYTYCSSNQANQLACRIHGNIAAKHGGQTAYIMMNGEKVFFIVPILEETVEKKKGDGCNDCG